MTLDLSKLAPAPWRLENEAAKIILSSDTVQRIAWVFDENHTEFLALARNAEDVMMRRGWNPGRDASGKWQVYQVTASTYCHLEIGSDAFSSLGKLCMGCDHPFTALIEADKWYKENVENKFRWAK